MRRSNPISWISAVALLAALTLVLMTRPAFAHGDEMAEPTATPSPAQGSGPRAMPVHLEIEVPEEAQLGEPITVRATLTDAHDDPVVGAMVIFETDAVWGEELQGHMTVGAAETDQAGVAALTYELRSSGDVEVAADFAGDRLHQPASEETLLHVTGGRQLYTPSVGLRIPWLNLWVIAFVVALVWVLYLAVGARLVSISRSETVGHAAAAADRTSRRQFLRRLLPLGAEVGVASFGAGLVALVLRSPHTHGNLLDPPSTAAYRRSPVARVGQLAEMREMPPPLDREVSFSSEVLPIFLASGGPHVVLPEHSPPPGALRLDSHAHVLEREGVVVPGDPEGSEMIEHLLSVGMQMPPSIPPLPDSQIQLIVTWIAQGAKDN